MLRQSGPFSLLVLAADGIGQDAVDVATKVRDLYDVDSLPMVLLLPPDVDRAVTLDLARDLRINQVLPPPAAPDLIVREIASLLNLSLSLLEERPLELSVSDVQDAARHRIEAVLARRLEALERSAKARDDGNTSNLLMRNGAFEAGKLAEQFRQLNNEAGARLATEVADLFGTKGHTGESATVLVDRLRHLLTGAADTTLQVAAEVSLPKVLFCDADVDGVQQWVQLGRSRGMMVAAAYDPQAALQLTQEQRPDVVVLDPAMLPGWDDMVQFFGRLQGVPILVHTRNSDQHARLAASRLGATAFVAKPVPVEDLLERVEQLLGRTERTRPRVLAVDDDELALAAIEVILTSHDIDCVTLQEPGQFWQTFEDMVPDLVVLDIEMPGVNGLELCRMIRNDPAWKTLPVLILTAATDPHVVASVYASGADDYAIKPITAEELVGRVLNRLERQRVLQRETDLEPTTGLLWRRRFAQTLTYLVRAHPQLCVAVLGIDCFQDVNLATDFESGDTMLRWMAGLLQRNLPEQAVLGRWCSDQFVVALPGVDLDGASQILEHTLANVRQEVFGDVAGRLLRLTFSAGVAQYQRDGVTVEELYAAAARGMALAKRNGRGAIVQSAWFETPGFLEEPAEVFLVHSDAELCRRLRRALQARARHVELVPPSRQLLSTLGMKLGQRSGVVVVLEVKSQDPDAWAVLRTFSRTRAAEATRLLVLLDQTTQSVKDEAFSLGAWFVLGADAQFPQLVQRIREALG